MIINKSLILIFFAVAVTGAAYFLGTQTKNVQTSTSGSIQTQELAPDFVTYSNTTVNWKTYTSNKYKFSFQYPPNSSVEVATLAKSEGFSGSVNLAILAADKCQAEKDTNIDLFTISTGNYPSIEEFKKGNNSFSPNTPFKETVFNGEKAVQHYYPGSSQTGGPQVALFFIRNGIDYQVMYRYCAKLGTITNDSEIPVMNPNILSTFRFSDQARSSDQPMVESLVNNFYKALEAQDGKLLFSYFTSPVTSEEKTSFNWLTGADLPGTPVYRIFFRQTISNPKINGIQVNDTVFVVKVSDQLTGVPSAGGETTVYTPQPRNVVLTIIKSGDKWMVDKFTDLSNSSNTGNAGSPKYNGFGQ